MLKLGGGVGAPVGLGKAAKEELLARALKQERAVGTEDGEKRKMLLLVWKELEKGALTNMRLKAGELWEVLFEMGELPFLHSFHPREREIRRTDSLRYCVCSPRWIPFPREDDWQQVRPQVAGHVGGEICGGVVWVLEFEQFVLSFKVGFYSRVLFPRNTFWFH